MPKRFVLLACALLAMSGFANRASAGDFWLSGSLTFTDVAVTRCWVVLRGVTSPSAPPGEFSGAIISASYSSVGGHDWACGIFVSPSGTPWAIGYDPSPLTSVRIGGFGMSNIAGSCGGTLSAQSQNLQVPPQDGQAVYFGSYISSVPGAPTTCFIEGMLTYSSTPPIFP